MSEPARIPLYLLCAVFAFAACVAAGFAVGHLNAASHADAAAARKTAYASTLNGLEPVSVAASRARGKRLGAARGRVQGRRAARRLLADRAADLAATERDKRELLAMARSSAIARRRLLKASHASAPRLAIPHRIVSAPRRPGTEATTPAPSPAPPTTAPSSDAPNATGGTQVK